MVPRGLGGQGDIKGSIGSCGNIWEGMKKYLLGQGALKGCWKAQAEAEPATVSMVHCHQAGTISL